MCTHVYSLTHTPYLVICPHCQCLYGMGSCTGSAVSGVMTVIFAVLSEHSLRSWGAAPSTLPLPVFPLLHHCGFVGDKLQEAFVVLTQLARPGDTRSKLSAWGPPPPPNAFVRSVETRPSPWPQPSSTCSSLGLMKTSLLQLPWDPHQ